MGKKYKTDLVELISKNGSIHIDDILSKLIRKYDIAKRNQKSFKNNIYINNLTKLVKEKVLVRSGKNIYSISVETSAPGFVKQYAEKIRREGLNTLKVLGKKFRTKTGFYFLYNGNNLYYVGIGNVLSRLTSHLKDIHKENWNMFSFYITEKIEHAKEIETIFQRNLKLTGNKNIGKLHDAKNLTEHINSFDTMLKDF